jgi:subtilisin family serine protease
MKFLVGAATALLAVLTALASARPQVAVCGSGRYLLPPGQRLVTGPAAAALDAVVLAGDTISIASGCPAQPARRKGRKSGTRIKVRWPANACGELRGRVRLNATIDSACGVMQGKLVAKKLKQSFRASRSTCGDGTVDRGGLETCEPPAPSCDATCGAGVPLAGAAETPLVDAVSAFHIPQGVPDDEIEADAGGRRVARTILDVGFAAGATVAQATALLDGIGGRIVDMVPHVPVVALRVPDPGSLAGLDALIARVAAAPGVAFVNKGDFGEDELPPNYDPSLFPPPESPLAKIGHHLGVRAHAAWNARDAIRVGEQPTVIVADRFGDGPPLDSLAATVVPEDFRTFSGFFVHGYFVLGVLAGDFGGPTSDRGLVTGIFPAASGFPAGLPIRVVDRAANITDAQTESRIVQLLVDVGAKTGARVVVNTSYGLSDVCNPVGNDCIDRDEATRKADAWVAKVRAAGLEGRYLHFTSAGNIDHDLPNVESAVTNSAFASAALLLAPPLAGTVVVENARGEGAPSFAPRCVSDESHAAARLAGIGTDVWSLDGPDAAVGASFRFGASYATPQVAGLAAYLWSIDPDLTPQQVVDTIRATSRVLPDPDGAGCSELARLVTSKVIDAYDAVLALDAGSLTPATAPVRLALLDVTGDGVFDAQDLTDFKAKYLDDQDQPIAEPAERDFGRFDLNGDGFTGGSRPARFDLDANQPPAYSESLTHPIGDAERTFNETAVTDLDILCFYAFSPLFAPGAAVATEQIGAQCLCTPPGGGQLRALAVDQCTTTTTLPPIVNNCNPADYVDRTDAAADRTVTFENFSLSPRCMIIRRTQTVSFARVGATPHAVAGARSDAPSDAFSISVPGSTTPTNLGVYGYNCTLHTAERGAIQVVP